MNIIIKTMETKSVKMEFDCIHDQAAGTMTCKWLGGRVQIMVDWKHECGVVLVNGNVKRQFSLVGLSVEEFMLIEEQTQEAATKLAVFNQDDAA